MAIIKTRVEHNPPFIYQPVSPVFSSGRDGAAQGSPSSSVNSQDGRYHEGRRAPRCETISWVTGSGGERRGTAGEDGKQRKTAGDGRGRHNVLQPRPSFSFIGQVDEMTGRTSPL